MWRTCGPMANRAACCAALLMAMGDTGAGAKTTRARSSSAGVLWPLDPCCSQRVIVGEQSFWTGSHFIAQETWRPFLTTHGVAGRSRQVTGVSGPNSRCGCEKRDWGKVNRVQHRCTRGETGRGSSRLSCCRAGVTSRHVSVEPRARARRRSRPLALFVYQLYVTSVFSKRITNHGTSSKCS
jgi:hypothetical protein